MGTQQAAIACNAGLNSLPPVAKLIPSSFASYILCTGGGDCKLRVFDVDDNVNGSSGNEAFPVRLLLDGHQALITECAFSIDGSTVVSGRCVIYGGKQRKGICHRNKYLSLWLCTCVVCASVCVCVCVRHECTYIPLPLLSFQAQVVIEYI